MAVPRRSTAGGRHHRACSGIRRGRASSEAGQRRAEPAARRRRAACACRVEKDEAFLLDQGSRKRVEQRLLVREALDPARVGQPFRRLRLTLRAGIELELLGELEPALLQHPAIRNAERSPGRQVYGTRQDVGVVLAPCGVGHHALEAVLAAAQEARAAAQAGRYLVRVQLIERLAAHAVFERVFAVFGDQLERQARAVAQGGVADVPVPAPVVPGHADGQIAYERHAVFPLTFRVRGLFDHEFARALLDVWTMQACLVKPW
jgi:hypothetical protein